MWVVAGKQAEHHAEASKEGTGGEGSGQGSDQAVGRGGWS